MKRSAALEARSLAATNADSGGARHLASRMIVRIVALALLLGTAYAVLQITTG